MNNILVTGVNGFVGHHLAKELSVSGNSVTGIGGANGSREQLQYLDDYFELELTNLDEIKQINFSNFNGVIHLAGLAAVGPSFDDPLGYLTTNVGIQVNLFEEARKQNAFPRFLIISSGALYDPGANLPLTEVSPVLPNSPYAVSKLSQEQMAQYYMSRGFDIIIARPFNHVGPGQAPGFIVPDIAQQLVACQKGEQNEVLVGNLDAKRDYTDVRDIARAYRLLLEKGVSGEIYNVCSGRALSGHEILDGLSKAIGFKAKIKKDETRMRPADHPVIYGDYTKLTKATGWEPEIPIEETLDDVIKDWRTRN